MYRSLSAVMPGIGTTWVIMEATMSRCGVTSLRMSTSWRLRANSAASWSSVGLAKIWSCSSSMRSSNAGQEREHAVHQGVQQAVQRDQPPVGVQAVQRGTGVGDGGDLAAVHGDEEVLGVEAVHLGERLVQAERAVGDEVDEILVVLDLRALVELLGVLDGQRVDLEDVAQQGDGLRTGVGQVQPEQRVVLQGAFDGRAGRLVLDAVLEQQVSRHGSMVPVPGCGASLDCPHMSTEPPPAKQVPHERTYHGDTVTDEYAWLAAKDDPDTIAYLKAENAYTEAVTAGLAPLQEQIFAEIKARTQESDLSVPVRKGDWWQYARTVEGQQYAVHCRRAVRPGEVIPPLAEDGQPLDGEEVLLDGNELAAGAGFFALGAYQPSPDWRWLAYSTDFSGDERFTIRIKDLATGALLPDEIPGTYYGCAWSLDGSALFYVTVDDAWRPYRVWRHRIGTPADQDVMVFEEADQRFHVSVGSTRSERYIVIHSASVLTSEVWLLDAAAPEGEFTVVTPRRQGLDYSVDHAGDRLLILHNDHAENFEIATAPLSAPRDWTPLVPHRADTRLLGMAAFADFIVVYFRRDGLTGLRVLPATAAVSGRSRSTSRSTGSGRDRIPSTTPAGSGFPTPR